MVAGLEVAHVLPFVSMFGLVIRFVRLVVSSSEVEFPVVAVQKPFVVFPSK